MRRKREDLINLARVFTEKLRREYGNIVVGAILIGSVARNAHGPRSDLDIVVIVKDRGAVEYNKIKIMASKILKYPTDILIIDEKTLEYHKNNNTLFYKELRNGEKLYLNKEILHLLNH